MTITIHPLQDNEISALSALAAVVFPLACPPTAPAAELERHISNTYSSANLQRWLADPGMCVRGAWDDGRLVGFHRLGYQSSPSVVPDATNPRELAQMYVHPDCHGRGVAAALMQDAAQLASSEGYDAFWLSVSKHNARAVAFYTKQGFRIFGEQIFWVGDDPQPDWLMVKPV